MNPLYEAVVEPEECLSCKECLNRCPVKAITLDEAARVDRDKCLGCGLCAGVCPCEAITMHLRSDRQEPFKNTFELGMAILKGKTENANKKIEIR